MIRKKIAELIKEACEVCKNRGFFTYEVDIEPIVEIPRENEFGDYSTNIAFILAPKVKKSPLDIAKTLVEHIDDKAFLEKTEVAGRGFINFYIKDAVWRSGLKELLEEGIDAYMPDLGKGRKVLIEFVSANPTGPLHIGHGRGAVVGDVLANILKAVKYHVVREYYINDAGRQIATLGESTYLRLKELKGEKIDFPDGFYKGEYIRDIASNVLNEGIALPEEKDKAVRFLSEFSSNIVLNGIKKDLDDFGVVFDSFFRESRLYESGMVDNIIEALKSKDMAYEKDGALWFRTSNFVKDEDRVLIKSDGEKTYFASDIAYHKNKLERGYDMLIDIWGSDHHGYIPRLKASMEALGEDKERLRVILIQFVTLLKDGKPIGMSTRAGQFTTLKEVLDEVGRDAARFFFLMRKSDAHLEFDLDLAKKTSNENPVYYVQYANARIESIFRNAREQNIWINDIKTKPANNVTKDIMIDLLVLKEEIDLIKGIIHFYDVIEGSARSLEPHRLTFYLIELVGRFHSYYNKARILTENRDLTLARLLLLYVLQSVIKYGLGILGVSAPDKM
ncbi:MAG TPA: arginine--tRNA ligase [Syntrophorhabdaceae bacterium]|nr:arginine--tRNA ligase [Syntrophorhabdaceae bacterium]